MFFFIKKVQLTVSEFETLTQSSFPHDFIDVNQFFDLIGDSPPRIYYLDNGKIANLGRRFC